MQAFTGLRNRAGFDDGHEVFKVRAEHSRLFYGFAALTQDGHGYRCNYVEYDFNSTLANEYAGYSQIYCLNRQKNDITLAACSYPCTTRSSGGRRGRKSRSRT